MVNCWRCQRPLVEADKLGSSFACPACGGATLPDGTRKGGALPVKAAISQSRRCGPARLSMCWQCSLHFP